MDRSKIWDKICEYLWNALVILLPITSFPLIVKLVGSDVVGLPSGVLLLMLVLAWYLPWLLKGGVIPRSSIPLLAFVAVAVFSSSLAVFRWIPVGSGGQILREEVTSLLTLALGVMMYLVAAHWTKQPGRLQVTLRLLNYTGALVILWSALQAVAWYTLQGYPQVMEVVHRTFSTGVLYKARVTGLALEPSWFAHQLNMLYLPFWFAATINRYSAHRSRIIRWFTWENLLLGAGVVALLLTKSRIGYLSFLAMSVVYFLQLNRQVARWVFQKFLKRVPNLQRDPSENARKVQQSRKSLRIAIFFGMLLFYVGLLVLVAVFFYRFDERMASVFTFRFDQDQWLYQYLGKLDIGPRVTFWLAGWGVFEQYPFFGVGLGNSGFYFWETIPDLGWTFEEVRRLMWYSSSVLNPKNLWVRLLAETGLVGFACFTAWLLSNTSIALSLRRQSNSPLIRTMGTMGVMVVLGLLVEGFSVDSFSLVYFWLSFGLVTSTYLQTVTNKEKEE